MFTHRFTQTSFANRFFAAAVFVGVLAAVGLQPARAQEAPPLPDDPALFPDAPQLTGIAEGIGTFFEVTDSDYVNITLASGEPISLCLESVPEMVVMRIASAEGALSTQVTLCNLPISTTLYKYEDNYRNGEAFTTGNDGCHTYTQDLSTTHLVFIQPRPSTIFLSETGWSDPTAGDWDPNTRTGTLTRDLYETVQIDSDGITLDGNGYTIRGTGTGNGVYLSNLTGCTVKNLSITGFALGIYVYECSSVILMDNTAAANGDGFRLWYDDDCIIFGNAADGNNRMGMYIAYCNYCTIADNTLSSNRREGLFITKRQSLIITGNNAYLNQGGGIHITGTANNIGGVVSDNTCWGNRYGLSVLSCHSLTLRHNVLYDNIVEGTYYDYNFIVRGSQYHMFIHDIDESNLVQGKPILYLLDPVNYRLENTDTYGTIYVIHGDNVVLRNLTLGPHNARGVYLWETENSLIENVTTSNGMNGIELENSQNNLLIGNNASWNMNGILLNNSPFNILQGNHVESNYVGIEVEGWQGIRDAHDVTLIENTAKGNGVSGIELHGTEGCLVIGNTVIGLKDGGGYTNNGIRVWSSEGSLVAGNICTMSSLGIRINGNANENIILANTVNNNIGSGIAIELDYRACCGNIVDSNLVSGNPKGIYVHGPLPILTIPNTIIRNTLSGNSVGVEISRAYGNAVYNNNFFGNAVQAQAGGPNTFNLAAPVGGNYWSDWTGPDVDGDGFVDVPYVFSGGQDDLPWTSPNAWGNQPPIANAGMDQSADRAFLVTLDGSASSDPDENYPLTFAWQFISRPTGSQAELNGATTVDPSFTPDMPGPYIVGLVVTDAQGLASYPDAVVIRARNTAPFADAGPDLVLYEPNTVVQLDGTQSYDEDGDPLAFFWTIKQTPPASLAALDDPASPTPSFVADVCGDYEIVLTVTDLFDASSTDSVHASVTCSPPDPINQILDLVAHVVSLNLQQGIDNSLDAKLDAALKALDDINANNDEAAVNALQSFINAVEAQRGNKITAEDADALIAEAQATIDVLTPTSGNP